MSVNYLLRKKQLMKVKVFILIVVFFLSGLHLAASIVSKSAAITVGINFLIEKYAKADRFNRSDIPVIKNITAVENAYFIINFNELQIVSPTKLKRVFRFP